MPKQANHQRHKEIREHASTHSQAETIKEMGCSFGTIQAARDCECNSWSPDDPRFRNVPKIAELQHKRQKLYEEASAIDVTAIVNKPKEQAKAEALALIDGVTSDFQARQDKAKADELAFLESQVQDLSSRLELNRSRVQDLENTIALNEATISDLQSRKLPDGEIYRNINIIPISDAAWAKAALDKALGFKGKRWKQDQTFQKGFSAALRMLEFHFPDI